ncbi:hypothetical protein ACHAXT_002594 [Thalassiosira profunda]
MSTLSWAAAALLLLAALPMGGRARLASPPGPDPPARRNFPPSNAPESAREIWLRLDLESDVVSWASTEGDAAAALFDEDHWYDFRPTDSTGGGERRWEVRRVPKTAAGRKLQGLADLPVEPIKAGAASSEEGTRTGEEETMFIFKNVLLSLSCVLMAALAAGLTMGLYSLDPLSLEIKRRASSDPKEQQWSEDLLPLLVGHSKRHRLLVSLLLLNSFANEALPLFLDELLPGKYASIIVSVSLVLLFGEIVPSAFFTGPKQVEMAAKLVPLVKTVMFVLSPIAVPIAKLLDRVLHDDSGGDHGSGAELDNNDVTEGNYYNRNELTAMVRIQFESQLADKRRRKQEHAVLLTKKPVVPGGTVVGAVGELSSFGAVADAAVAQHLTNQSSRDSRESAFSVGRHTHHSVRTISRELTRQESTRSPNSILSAQRMPSIHHDEITMIEGALTMTTKRAADVCTPLRRVYALPSDTVLDEQKKVEIWARGYSRVPVYNPKSDAAGSSRGSVGSYEDIDISGIVGVLLVRQLIVIDSAECRPISTLPLATPSCVSPGMHLVDLINMFQASGGRGKGGLHLAIVCARPRVGTEALERGEPIPKEAGVVGIVTLEDVVEELLQEEIYDEADRDLELSRWGVRKWQAFVKRKKVRRSRQQKRVGFTDEQTPLLK